MRPTPQPVTLADAYRLASGPTVLADAYWLAGGGREPMAPVFQLPDAVTSVLTAPPPPIQLPGGLPAATSSRWAFGPADFGGGRPPTVTAPRLAHRRDGRPPDRRRPALALLGAVATLVLAVLVLGSLGSSDDPPVATGDPSTSSTERRESTSTSTSSSTSSSTTSSSTSTTVAETTTTDAPATTTPTTRRPTPTTAPPTTEPPTTEPPTTTTETTTTEPPTSTTETTTTEPPPTVP